MEEWLTSLSEWAAWPSVLSRVDLVDKARAIEKALAKLGIAHVVRAHEPSYQQAQTGGTRWMGGFVARWGRRAGADGRRRFGMRSWP